MIDAWGEALKYSGEYPDLKLIINLAGMIEPDKNNVGLRDCEVMVGDRKCPPSICVLPMLEELIADTSSLNPLQYYRQFELIHPFRDGNGRTGKILLNMLNGTLHKPIFPPDDFWGYLIKNP